MPFFAEFVFSKEFVGTVRDVSVWHLAKPWAHWAAAGHVPLRFVVDGGGRRGSDNVTQYARWGQEASLARWPIQAPIAQVGDSSAGRPAAHKRFEERILVNAR